MVISILNKILAIVLPSLRISPLLLIRIATIVLFYVAALYLSVVYIQSIGSDIVIFSGLFQGTLKGQSIETFFYLVNALNFTLNGPLLSSLVPVKPDDDKPSRRLTKAERSQFTLSEELRQILVGLLLGDLYAQKPKGGVNVYLGFKQSIVHKDYLLHLYDLFKIFSSQAPKLSNMAPHKLTGKVYSSMWFNTWSLPCFLSLYELFYVAGSKVVPSNIDELLTPLGLAYWIADDGGFNKRDRAVVLSTQSFSKEEVNLLVGVLNNKFKLNCTINKNTNGFVIRIPSKSLPILQALLKDIMPAMMIYKIGLE